MFGGLANSSSNTTYIESAAGVAEGARTEIPWGDAEEAIAAFVTMLAMPFTWSITNGIGAGFVTYAAIKVLNGKGYQVHAGDRAGAPLTRGVANPCFPRQFVIDSRHFTTAPP